MNSVFCSEFNIRDLIVNDKTVEDDQTLILELQNVTPPQIMGILSPEYVNITIWDDDGKHLNAYSNMLT